jgi:multidrug efflux pump subunit AcrB
VGLHQGTPVYLADVAEVKLGSDQPERYVWLGTGPAAAASGIKVEGEFPAVTLAIAKKPGENAVAIANQVIERVERLKGTFIPEGINVTVTRNYGLTANDKAMTLIAKLIFATTLVIVLVLLALGWREALVVGAAVILTLTITLFASWAWGFTLNRVSLFALIFSIGILVDDAIVVVENIHRHMRLGDRRLVEAIPLAVDEVGGPTILATFTVIAALLPMAFVSGLMGPYMSPIPINSSMGMLISLAVAFVFTPWLTYKVLRRIAEKHGPSALDPSPRRPGEYRRRSRRAGRFLPPTVSPGRRAVPARAPRPAFALGVGDRRAAADRRFGQLGLFPARRAEDAALRQQVGVSGDRGHAGRDSLEQTTRVLGELGRFLATIEEVTDYQVYAGTAAPINFNGLVRQYYLRTGANVGDIQVNLVDKKHRHRKSHDIALAVRGPLQEIGERYGANVKVVEVPPGPPVMSPLVAEIYGLDYPGQIRGAQQVRAVFQRHAGHRGRGRYGRGAIRTADRPCGPGESGPARRVAAGGRRRHQHRLRGEDVSYLHSSHRQVPDPAAAGTAGRRAKPISPACWR